MSRDPEQDKHKQRVASVFNLVSSGYDHPALRFFPFCADHMVGHARLRPGSKVLDVATGTGAVAVSAAQVVGPGGRVAAIDLAEEMLDRAFQHAQKMAVDNVDFHVMDAQELEFRSKYFDYVLCSFGVFFLPDMQAGVREWLRVVRPGGTVMFSTFGAQAFQPLAELFRARIESFGVQAFDRGTQAAWMKLTDAQECRELMAGAGAMDVQVHERQLGYHLAVAEDWWAVLWNSGFRGLLEQLDAVQLGRFREQHLAEVERLVTEDGIWLDVEARITEGRRPAA